MEGYNKNICARLQEKLFFNLDHYLDTHIHTIIMCLIYTSMYVLYTDYVWQVYMTRLVYNKIISEIRNFDIQMKISKGEYHIFLITSGYKHL